MKPNNPPTSEYRRSELKLIRVIPVLGTKGSMSSQICLYNQIFKDNKSETPLNFSI